jgi:hypothetical protein
MDLSAGAPGRSRGFKRLPGPAKHAEGVVAFNAFGNAHAKDELRAKGFRLLERLVQSGR